ncbi:hypothetical protein Fmac_004408 [Flemingia macrophylla]|uniref:Ribosomal protein S14 n=1 Tax=Flemingia macrophylla TaxID=520843 RepID=A0ABD1N4T9_9FABA
MSGSLSIKTKSKRDWRGKRRSEGLEKNYCSSKPIRRIRFLELEYVVILVPFAPYFPCFCFSNAVSCAEIKFGTREH